MAEFKVEPGPSIFLFLFLLSPPCLTCSVPSRGSGRQPPGQRCLPALGAKPMAGVASSTSYAMPLLHASPLHAARSPSARTPRAARCRLLHPDKLVGELTVRQTGCSSHLPIPGRNNAISLPNPNPSHAQLARAKRQPIPGHRMTMSRGAEHLPPACPSYAQALQHAQPSLALSPPPPVLTKAAPRPPLPRARALHGGRHCRPHHPHAELLPPASLRPYQPSGLVPLNPLRLPSPAPIALPRRSSSELSLPPLPSMATTGSPTPANPAPTEAITR
jgi:hypothetical protein